MLRLSNRGRFVVCDNLEKCLKILGSSRDTCSAAIVSKVREGWGGDSMLRSNCLIDATVLRTVAIQKQNRRLSSTSTINEAQKTCLYNLHVEKQGELRFEFLLLDFKK